MMFKKLREKRYINKNIKKHLDLLFSEIERIRNVSEIIAICSQPTGDSYRGIHTATIGLFPDCTFVIPQYFSKPVYDYKELTSIVDKIIKAGFSKVIISGTPPYFGILIELINKLKKINNTSLKVLLIYHGSLASNAEDEDTPIFLQRLIQLAIDRKIDKLGFVKKGMKETFEKLLGIQTNYLLLKTNTEKRIEPLYDINKEVHVGIFTHDQYRKNIHNQVAAALMIENAKVHLKKTYSFEYLHANDRFILHGYSDSYCDFLNILGSMNINLYVTFSECWGQIITESMMLGVPCLTAYSSGVFDYDEELKKILVVEDFDNSDAIYQQAKTVLENRDKISKLGKEYVIKLNKIAEEKLKSFLSD